MYKNILNLFILIYYMSQVLSVEQRSTWFQIYMVLLFTNYPDSVLCLFEYVCTWCWCCTSVSFFKCW